MMSVLDACKSLLEATNNRQKRTQLCRLEILLLGERDVGAAFWFAGVMTALMGCLEAVPVDVQVQVLMVLLTMAKQTTNRRCLVCDCVGLVDVLVGKAVVGESKEVKSMCLLVLSYLLRDPGNLHDLGSHRGLLEALMYSARSGDGLVVQLWSSNCLELLSRGKRCTADSIVQRYNPHSGETELELDSTALVSFWVHVNGVLAIRSAQTSACAIRRLPQDLCRLVFQVLET